MYTVQLSVDVMNPNKKFYEQRKERNTYMQIMADDYKLYQSDYIKFFNNDIEVACLQKAFVVAIKDVG